MGGLKSAENVLEHELLGVTGGFPKKQLGTHRRYGTIIL